MLLDVNVDVNVDVELNVDVSQRERMSGPDESAHPGSGPTGTM